MDPPKAHFALAGTRPGDYHENIKIQLSMLCSFAYSRLWNRRNTEHPWYGYWDLILRSLVIDFLPLVIMPQYPLYFVEDNLVTSSSRRHPAPAAGDAESLQEESIDSTTSTQAERGAKTRIPDFVILCKRHEAINPQLQLGTHIPSFRDCKIRKVAAPLIAEIKRRAPRGLHGENLYRAVRQCMAKAAVDAEAQAKYLFTMFPKQRWVILVACTGEFWSYRVMTSSYFQNNDPDKEGAAALDLDDELEFDDHEVNLIGTDNIVAEIYDDEDMATPVEEDISHSAFEPVLQSVPPPPLRQDDPDWSRLFKIGTTASNQRFYMIHEHLRETSLRQANEPQEG